jgi:poly(A) polymerase
LSSSATPGARRHSVEGPKCRRYAASEHGIHPESIGDEALEVCLQLRRAGHEAYLVGGCVRDLLLGLEPKDFDVSTNAHPEQVHALFRRSRIVGRRFQIVHVRVGREIIEVSTFRGHHSPGFEAEPDAEEGDESRSKVRADSGMLLRDNVFGTVEEDALRRDFTVNGLYYDPDSRVVIDFSTGVPDLSARVLRVMGDPRTRFQEDPVRMLRAVRFGAKLDFTIDPFAVAAIARSRELLLEVPAARMFDEVLKLLLAGHGETTFALLEKHRLFELLFPDTASALQAAPGYRAFVLAALRNGDQRVAEDRPVTPAFLYGALLWPPLALRIAALERDGATTFEAMARAAPDVIARQARLTTIPRRFSTPMREIWDLQHRLVARRQAQRLASHPRFRAAYDFLLLREQAGEALDGAGDWWTRFQAGEDMPAVAAPAAAPRPRRRRGGRRRGTRPDAG